MFEWLNVSPLQFVIWSSVENDVYKDFADKEMYDAGNHQ